MRPEQIKSAVDKLALPPRQKRELDRRHKARQHGESGLHDWEDVHAALRGKRR